MKFFIQKIVNKLGFQVVKLSSYEKLLSDSAASATVTAQDVTLQQGHQDELTSLRQQISFYTHTPDYEIGFKEKAAVDAIEAFGNSDFAELAPWLFSSSLSNHRVVHQRIDEASMLWKVVKQTAGPILEVGRAAGGSTLVLLGASGTRQVESVDRFPQHADIVNYIFDRPENAKRLRLYSQSSRDPMPINDYGMIFIDGDHSYDGVCHDIAIFWNRLKSHEGKPAYAVFHDAAKNPMSYVEPVRQAVDELIQDPGVARVAGSWGSMLVLEKTNDIDERKWFAKLDSRFWKDCLQSNETFVEPDATQRVLQTELTDVALLSASAINGDNFNDQGWIKSGLLVESTDKFGADNPLRILRQSEGLSEHSISTIVTLDAQTYYFSAHLRPLGNSNVSIKLMKGDVHLFSAVYSLDNTPKLIDLVDSNSVEVHTAKLGYRNGYFHCEIIASISEATTDLNFKISMLTEDGAEIFEGVNTKALAINSACIHLIGQDLSKLPRNIDLDDPIKLEMRAERDKILSLQTQEEQMQWHGSPFVVLDDVLTDALIDDLNRYWPNKDVFKPEILGSDYFGLYEQDLLLLSDNQRAFWTEFRNEVGPAIIAKVADAFHPVISSLFPKDLTGGLSTHGAMLLMEQSEAYEGQGLHTHFYHNPNWVFTMLFYVGDDKGINPGTSIEYLDFGKQEHQYNSNYGPENLEEKVVEATEFMDVAPRHKNLKISSKTIKYKKNRVFAFMDGPLSFHKVTHSRKSGNVTQRRIIRAHVKVDFEKFMNLFDKSFTPDEFAKVMYPTSEIELSDEEQKMREEIKRVVYEKRIIEFQESVERANHKNDLSDTLDEYFTQIQSYRP